MSATKNVVGLSIGAILIATLGVTAIGTIENASTAGWSSSTVAIWAVMGIVIVIAFVLVVLTYADIV